VAEHLIALGKLHVKTVKYEKSFQNAHDRQGWSWSALEGGAFTASYRSLWVKIDPYNILSSTNLDSNKCVIIFNIIIYVQTSTVYIKLSWLSHVVTSPHTCQLMSYTCRRTPCGTSVLCVFLKLRLKQSSITTVTNNYQHQICRGDGYYSIPSSWINVSIG